MRRSESRERHTGSIHLLLSDLVMPVMTGQELATELCAIYPDMKVLFMSACSVETAEDYNVRLAPGEPFLGQALQHCRTPAHGPGRTRLRGTVFSAPDPMSSASHVMSEHLRFVNPNGYAPTYPI